jgi:ligand-binding sensor domain-containing protein
MLNRLSVSFLLTVVICYSAAASEWRSYTNSDAIRQIVVRHPEVWAATQGGAVARNYSAQTQFRMTNIDGLGSIDLRCVETDTSDNLWFGAGNGWLTRVSQILEIRNYPVRDSAGLIARAITINDLKNDGDRLWVASDLGVSKFLIYSNGGEIKDTARRLGNLPSLEDAVCVEVVGPNLWVGTASGIAFIDKDNQNIQYFGNWRSFSRGQSGLDSASIRTIASYHDTVLAGTQYGVYKFVVAPDTQWQSFGLAGRAVNRLFMSDTLLMAATNNGIFRYFPSGWSQIPSAELPNNRANDLAIDKTGTLWAGTPSSGIAEFVGGSWLPYTIPGPASNIINKLAIDSVGGIWMTHDGKGLTRFSGDEWQKFTMIRRDYSAFGPVAGLFDPDPDDITVTADGIVWIASFGGGLYRHDIGQNSWFKWNYRNSPMYGVLTLDTLNHSYWAATGLKNDNSGNIWITAFGSDSLLMMGVYAPYSPDSLWQTFKASDMGLTTNFAYTFLVDGNIVWVGRGDGLSRLDHNGTPFDLSDDQWQPRMSILDVRDMALDNSGTLWLATVTGLFYISAQSDSAENFDLPIDIPGSVNAMETDGIGNIWVGTTTGLGVLRPNRDNPNNSRWDAIYTTANSQLSNNKVNGIAIDIGTGTVYLGTDGGLSIYESGVLPPSPDLTDMGAFPNPVTLAGDDTEIEFSRVPSTGILSIYTAGGDLVDRIDLSQTNRWDLRNAYGKRIAGGIYFFHVKSGDASGTGKFAVIR